MVLGQSAATAAMQAIAEAIIGMSGSKPSEVGARLSPKESVQERPNILFCLADDQSYPHASAYGEPVIKTLVFDRIASEGVLFTQAYCAAPSCTPSRSAILTGQDIWRVGQGGQLFGTLPVEHVIYTDQLTGSGYYGNNRWKILPE